MKDLVIILINFEILKLLTQTTQYLNETILQKT